MIGSVYHRNAEYIAPPGSDDSLNAPSEHQRHVISALSRIRTLTVVRHVLGVGPNTSRSPLLYPPEKRDPTNLLGGFSSKYLWCLLLLFPNIKMK
ncbi:hypothetical protein AVEN_266242-1 [Araneus ventricosus]|uniref:Uncharacterized protein n=1 Tax=Araneus ventricosus TaxID=182803 RepID=A0A4Y2R2T7_ARAVE|nr:hypothetical protein AVEN_266242-1 [Araneus ventricosus]